MLCGSRQYIFRRAPRAEKRTGIADFDSRPMIERGTTKVTVAVLISHTARTVSHEIAYIIIIISV
jgi:hypothetical protein